VSSSLSRPAGVGALRRVGPNDAPTTTARTFDAPDTDDDRRCGTGASAKPFAHVKRAHRTGGTVRHQTTAPTHRWRVRPPNASSRALTFHATLQAICGAASEYSRYR
jgi:hypothetical protein